MFSLPVLTFLLGLLSVAVFVILHQNTNVITIPGLTKQDNKQPTIIITGPSNSGKTALFNYLTSGKVPSTVTSQEPNITHQFKLPTCGGNQRRFKLAEFPGHSKLQSLVHEEIKGSSNIVGILFVLDSSTDPKQLGQVAKMLYEVLSISETRPGGVDILVACNKSDLFSARQSTKIRELLEQEVDLQRKLESASVSKVEDDIDSSPIGDLGQSLRSKFKFDLLEGNFDVVSGSVLKGEVDKWECWIDERAINF